MRTFDAFVKNRLGLLRFKGGIAGVARQSKNARSTVHGYLTAVTPAAPDDGQSGTLDAIADVLKFDSWEELVDAYEKDDPRRGILPDFAQHQRDTGQLRILNPKPTAIIEAMKRLDEEGVLQVLKSVDPELLRDALGEKPTGPQRVDYQPRGVLAHHQLDALAEAQDVAAFEQLVKEVLKQVKGRTGGGR